jgi:hypothetical protein
LEKVRGKKSTGKKVQEKIREQNNLKKYGKKSTGGKKYGKIVWGKKVRESTGKKVRRKVT